jgi:hypothetical protein
MSEAIVYPEDYVLPNEWENEETESVANYILNDAFAAQLRSRTSSYKDFVYECNKFSIFASPQNVSLTDPAVRDDILNGRLWDS